MQMYISHEVTFTSLMEAVCGRKKVWRLKKIPPTPQSHVSKAPFVLSFKIRNANFLGYYFKPKSKLKSCELIGLNAA